jgi:hypothetical protein
VLAEDAVRCEPVSASEFPLVRELTGNIVNRRLCRSIVGIKRPKTTGVLVGIPCEIESGILWRQTGIQIRKPGCLGDLTGFRQARGNFLQRAQSSPDSGPFLPLRELIYRLSTNSGRHVCTLGDACRRYVKTSSKGMSVVKKRKSGGAVRAREAATEDASLPMVDPDFPIAESDPTKLRMFARGLLNRLRNPSRSYPFETVKAATVWLIGAYVDAQVPLAPEMYPLIAGVVKWNRRASTFREVQEINEPAYWAAIRFEASKPPDPTGKAPSTASLYSVAKHVLTLKEAGLPSQGTRIPRNIDEEPDASGPQKSAEATIRGWRKIDHYRQNVRLQRDSSSHFNNMSISTERGGVKS